MQTTSVLVELLIIGGALVLTLFAPSCRLLGLDPTQVASSIELKDALVIAFCVSYPLGIAWSRVCDWLTSAVDNRIQARFFTEPESYHKSLAIVLRSPSPLAESMTQVRSTYRVARASSVTFLLASVLTLSGWIPTTEAIDGRRSAIALLLLAASAASFWSWLHLRASYLKYVALAANPEKAT